MRSGDCKDALGTQAADASPGILQAIKFPSLPAPVKDIIPTPKGVPNVRHARSVAITLDGATLVSAYDDGSIR